METSNRPTSLPSMEATNASGFPSVRTLITGNLLIELGKDFGTDRIDFAGFGFNNPIVNRNEGCAFGSLDVERTIEDHPLHTDEVLNGHQLARILHRIDDNRFLTEFHQSRGSPLRGVFFCFP